MWYIFLRNYSDTELLLSPKYNEKIKELINKITYMQVDFAFRSEELINLSNRPITTIQEFIREREYWYNIDYDDEEYRYLKELKNEIN